MRVKTDIPALESHAGVRQFYQEWTECILCMCSKYGFGVIISEGIICDIFWVLYLVAV